MQLNFFSPTSTESLKIRVSQHVAALLMLHPKAHLASLAVCDALPLERSHQVLP